MAKGGAHSSWETFAWERRSSWRIELGFDAWVEGEEAASYRYRQLGAASLHYLLERLQSRGGRMGLAHSFFPGEVSSHQNSEIAVADWSQQQDSHSCGGDSLSDISVEFWSRSGSFRGGAPHFPPSGSVDLIVLPFWSCYCTRFIIVLYLLF